jgi:hypothetical protein
MQYSVCVNVQGQQIQNFYTIQLSLFYCFYGAILDSYQENLVLLGVTS